MRCRRYPLTPIFASGSSAKFLYWTSRRARADPRTDSIASGKFPSHFTGDEEGESKQRRRVFTIERTVFLHRHFRRSPWSAFPPFELLCQRNEEPAVSRGLPFAPRAHTVETVPHAFSCVCVCVCVCGTEFIDISFIRHRVAMCNNVASDDITG